MTPSSRDRISVDLRGLKAALFDRAKALGMLPSELVRMWLAEALEQTPPDVGRSLPSVTRAVRDRARLCLRMSREEVRVTLDAARRARLPPGAYVAGLASNVPVLTSGGGRTDHIRALTMSGAELATLSRNIHRLITLLRQADVEPARAYRTNLDTLASDVRRHLELSARVLADLQPRLPDTGSSTRNSN